MATRKYFLPIIQDGAYRRPKYVNENNMHDWKIATYGDKDFCLLTATVNNTQHTAIDAEVDVFSIPENETVKLSTDNITEITKVLEDIGHVPCDFLNTNTTWEEALMVINGFFLICQRYFGQNQEDYITDKAKLDTQLTASLGDETKLINAASSLGVDTSDISSTKTARECLKILGEKQSGTTIPK